MNKSIRIKVIVGSTRQNRFSDMPAQWIFDQLKNIENIETEILDLRDYPMPFFDEAITPSAAKEPYSNPVVQQWSSKIAEADGFIIATAEYNHGYPAVLKNALDYTNRDWNKKPVSFISWGSAGGSRAVEQLRQVVAELQMVSIRTAVHIFGLVFMEAKNEKPGAQPSALDALKKTADTMIEQLLWWARALKTAREQ